MRRSCCVFCAVAVLLAASWAVAADQSKPLDLRRAVPADAHLAVYGRHNPERDFQREYYREVWKTVEETRLVERVVKIVAEQMPEEDLEQARSVFEEIRKAAEPIDFEAIASASEGVYAQTMQVPFTQHLGLIRLDPEAAAGWEQGINNLFALAEEYSEGQARVKTAEEGDATLTTLAFSGEVPFRLTCARIGDVLMLCSSEQLARRSLRMLVSGEGGSKFDDPRLKQALGRLPEPEDALVFYDGKRQFRQLRGLGDFIRRASHNDPEAERVAEVVELIFDECSILDYEVTVEYTEGNQNRSAAYGKLLPGAEDKVLMKALTSGKPFENWQAWVPAEALSYSLNTGINLHPIYKRAVQTIEQRFPEARDALEEFEQVQREHDVYLDRDILQAFSGENVCVSLPATASLLGSTDSVIALRCHKPERIRELLHRAVDALKEHPFGMSQQLKLIECAQLEGFEELSAAVLTMFGTRPVIGFRDGWMIAGSNAPAVEKVLDAKAGRGETIADTEAFQRFDLKVEGPVYAVSYTNLAEQIRGFAQVLGRAGAMAQMAVGMAGIEADPEDVKPVQEVLGLLPDVAKIIARFDFLEEQVSVAQAGDQPQTYVRRKVILVRPEAEE